MLLLMAKWCGWLGTHRGPSISRGRRRRAMKEGMKVACCQVSTPAEDRGLLSPSLNVTGLE